jgi:asparagine synthase (glutamine-hydrolysing)
MRDVLFHRGPDASGNFFEQKIGLGHRRLSIVDVARGTQPMYNEDDSIVIVYNGEVYNHTDFREELIAKGHRFETHSDTETIIHLFEEYGANCVEKLRGMFAFAIYDRREKILFIARDRLGVKPLYYVYDNEGNLFFASEIKSLLEVGAVKPELNYGALPDQLANHGTSGEQTLFKDVNRLMPGHTMLWRDGKLSIAKYWDVSFEPKHEERRDEVFVNEWRELFRQSVKLRLMSDVPLGMFLSGGIDSSAIAAMMSKMIDEPVKTFSVAFKEKEANELEYARLIARDLRTDHHEIVITPEEFFETLPKLIWHEDEPLAFVASVPLYFVSKLAQQHVKVVLTGEGSDELLAGYARYRKTLLLLSYGEKYEHLVPDIARRILRDNIGKFPFANKLQRTFLANPADIENLYFNNFAVFTAKMQDQLLTSDAKAKIGEAKPFDLLQQLDRETDAKEMLDRLLYADIKTYLHELLMKQDQMSMAASVESRVPFLDHKLVEFTAKMPLRMKLRGRNTKWILREAMKGILPVEILSRKKMGFPVPVGNWFRNKFRYVVEEFVLSERALSRGIFESNFVRELVAKHNAGENHDERIWFLVNFEMWQRRFLDGETAIGESSMENQLVAV